MKKSIYLISFLLLASSLFPQLEQHEITVRNIVVPLRVFDGDHFVENLTIDDLELYEDGKLQKIQALYLTKKAQMEKRIGASRDYMPYVGRSFYFLFQISEYNPKIAEALDYFFTHMYSLDDQVFVMTPFKNYTLSREVVKAMTKEDLVREIQSIVRKDTILGASEYNNQLKYLKRIVRSISSVGGGRTGTIADTTLELSSSIGMDAIDSLLSRYRDALQRMEGLRVVDEKKFLRFAAQLKRLEGQKTVFFFYQREFRPEIQPRILSNLMSIYQDEPNIIGQLQELFQFYHRDLSVNVDNLKKAFADSFILFNFIFMNKRPEGIYGIYMREQSEDFFRVFSDIAHATGGIVDTSQNPATAFKTVSKLTERCYLLYYSPEKYNKDGKFKNIVVKVKNKDYKVIHRLGYFAN